MEPGTNNANVRDWLEATKEMRILAYVERIHAESSMALRAISGEPFSGTLNTEDSLTTDILDAERDIQSIISGLYSGENLNRSVELQSLAEEAIQHSHMCQDDDVEQWARRLADDASQNTD